MWTQPRDDQDLQKQHVDIWRVFLDVRPDSVHRAAPILSADESERASRFHFGKDRRRFILAHCALRNILARYLRCEPQAIVFFTNKYGKPILTDSDIEFNLSHSGDYALVAVSRNRSVGVDVEKIRADLEIENLASRYFSPGEISELMALPPEQRMFGFFHCWTRKEAYIKAQGLGLSLPLDSFDVSLAPGSAAILRATRPDLSEAARWTLISLDVGSGYAAAAAVEGRELEFRFLDWSVAAR